MTTQIDDAWLDAFQSLSATPKKPRGMPPAKMLSMLLRPSFTARKGKTLVWGDWSAIEARVLPWLAGSTGGEAKLDIFRENDADPNSPDVYVRTGAALNNLDVNEVWAAYLAGDPKAEEIRQAFGKVPELSLGFGGGLGALLAMATNYGVYLDTATAQRVVNDWRSDNGWAKVFWGGHGRDGSYGLWGAINQAVDHPDTIFSAGRVAYVYDRNYLGGTLFCALPCSRLLTYPGIKWSRRTVKDKKTKEEKEVFDLSFIKGHGRTAMWYGKACLAGDTLVATTRGWVRLDAVDVSDLLWDGVEWVRHKGLCFQGYKHTVPLDGVRMTPDHGVLTADGWQQAKDCDGLQRATVRLPDCLKARAPGVARKASSIRLSVRLRRAVRDRFGWVGAAKPEAFAPVLRLQAARYHESCADDARYVEAPSLRSVALDAGPLQAALASGVAQLRSAGHLGVRALDVVREFLGRHGAFVRTQVDAGSDRQQRRLRTEQLSVGVAQGAGAEQAQQFAGEHAGPSERDRIATLDRALSLEPEAVFDVLDAGPRARFVALGVSGPMIVHNCENVTQGFAASILRRALRRLESDWADEKTGPLSAWMPAVMHTHDEIVAETDEDFAPEAKRVLKHLMERNDTYDAGLPLKAEVKSNWAYKGFE